MPVPPAAADFISREHGNDWFATQLLQHQCALYHCEFHREHYRDPLFAELAIKLPESLDKAVVKRRAEFLAGRYCAQKALQNLGIEEAALAIGKHRNPLWPETMIGSISHCGNHAVAIAASGTKSLGIGIDIEDEIASETMAKIQRQILSEEEIVWLAQQHFAAAPLLFTLAFSLKESFFKAAYPTVGHYFDFDAVSLVAINWPERSLTLRIDSDLHQTLGKGTLIEGAFQLLPEQKIVTLVIINHC